MTDKKEVIMAGDNRYRVITDVVPTQDETMKILNEYCSKCKYNGGCTEAMQMRRMIIPLPKENYYNRKDYLIRLSLIEEHRKEGSGLPVSPLVCRMFELPVESPKP